MDCFEGKLRWYTSITHHNALAHCRFPKAFPPFPIEINAHTILIRYILSKCGRVDMKQNKLFIFENQEPTFTL